MHYPPSPVDSLNGIDLDAYLDAQPALSHFPTPPSRSAAIVDARPNSAPSDPTPCNDSYLALLLAEEASIDLECTPDDIDLVWRTVLRAQLPAEILFMSLNILTGLNARIFGAGDFYDTPPDLLVIAALSLASSYTNDHPPSSAWWSRHVANGTWTAARIDKTILKLFIALDFRLHEYSNYESVQRTASYIAKQRNPATPDHDVPTSSSSQCHFSPRRQASQKQPLRLLIDDAHPTAWINGQITPGSTPPTSACEHECFGGLCMPLGRFQPLL